MAKRKQGPTYLKERRAKEEAAKAAALKGLASKEAVTDNNLKGLSHPKGVEETPLERMIKNVAGQRGAYLEEDRPYLEQYLHPEHDVLEKQVMRPSINPPGKGDALEYRRPQVDSQGLNLEGLGGFKYDETNPEYDSIYDLYDFDTKSPIAKSRVGVTGIKSILPSIEDYIAKEVMQRMGKPYNIYERVPKGTLNKPSFKDKK